jgi:hypothetical protein
MSIFTYKTITRSRTMRKCLNKPYITLVIRAFCIKYCDLFGLPLYRTRIPQQSLHHGHRTQTILAAPVVAPGGVESFRAGSVARNGQEPQHGQYLRKWPSRAQIRRHRELSENIGLFARVAGIRHRPGNGSRSQTTGRRKATHTPAARSADPHRRSITGKIVVSFARNIVSIQQEGTPC